MILQGRRHINELDLDDVLDQHSSPKIARSLKLLWSLYSVELLMLVHPA